MINKVRIACVQMDIIPGEVEKNLRRIVKLIAAAADERAQLVVFPEVATTDYYVTDFASLAAPVTGEQSEIISQEAKRAGVWVAAGLIELTPQGLYNTSILISTTGELVGKYRKTHLSVDSRNGTIAKETDIFFPGEDIPVFQTPFGTVGMMICKDGDYPEVPRVLAVKGAEIILWMTNRGGVDRVAASFYASANCTVIVIANRAKGHAAGGGSIILNWKRDILAEAGEYEGIIIAEVDRDALAEARRAHWRRDRIRRPELYKILGDIKYFQTETGDE